MVRGGHAQTCWTQEAPYTMRRACALPFARVARGDGTRLCSANGPAGDCRRRLHLIDASGVRAVDAKESEDLDVRDLVGLRRLYRRTGFLLDVIPAAQSALHRNLTQGLPGNLSLCLETSHIRLHVVTKLSRTAFKLRLKVLSHRHVKFRRRQLVVQRCISSLFDCCSRAPQGRGRPVREDWKRAGRKVQYHNSPCNSFRAASPLGDRAPAPPSRLLCSASLGIALAASFKCVGGYRRCRTVATVPTVPVPYPYDGVSYGTVAYPVRGFLLVVCLLRYARPAPRAISCCCSSPLKHTRATSSRWQSGIAALLWCVEAVC